ncbi:MAG: DUF2927 domain-containing protein [Rhodobacteraceae bacterium]|nr:DUF2927 domain-containing protein [Paracoccaceae bacterium]
MLLGVLPSISQQFSLDDVISGFNKTVFGTEYRTLRWRAYRVKKFSEPIRVLVINKSHLDRSEIVSRFIHTIDQKVRGIDMAVTKVPAQANFHVFIVDRSQYEDVARTEVFGSPDANVPGSCMAQIISGKDGIDLSSAIVVADEGEFRFRRCMIEEILQGLGPLNDDAGLEHSIFNDDTHFTSFTQYDRILLNMLYDPRVKHGASQDELNAFVPLLARSAWRFVTMEEPPN